MENIKALLFCVYFPLTVVSLSVSLYPSEFIVAPLGSTVFINCSFNRSSQNTNVYWNISDELLRFTPSPDRGINVIAIDTTLIGLSKLSVVLNPVNADLDIQCQLCDTCTTDSPAQDFTVSTDPLQVNAFGPPSSLSHELRENDTVKLSWLPPLVEAVPLFTYNIIIMELTTNLPVTDINITNNTYVIISPANITNYTECTSYQWGVRAAANLSYGFTDLTMANDTFGLYIDLHPNVSENLVIVDINSTVVDLQFNVTVPCNISLLINYTYTLLQRDYCQAVLDSSQIMILMANDIDAIPNTMIPISVNIGSLIHDSTWSVAVEVSNRLGSYTTDYTNITGRSSNQCYSKSIPISSSMRSDFTTRSNTVQISSVTAITVYSTIYNTVTVTPLTNVTATVTPSAPNVIPVVIGTTATVMILLIVVIILVLIFIVLICCRRTAESHQDGNTNAVELETCPAYGDISIVKAENNEAYNKRDEFTEKNYETLN